MRDETRRYLFDKVSPLKVFCCVRVLGECSEVYMQIDIRDYASIFVQLFLPLNVYTYCTLMNE